MFYLVTTNGKHWSVCELETESISTIPYEKHGTLCCEVGADSDEDALKKAKATITVDAIKYYGEILNQITALVEKLNRRDFSNKEMINFKCNGGLNWFISQLETLVDAND